MQTAGLPQGWQFILPMLAKFDADEWHSLQWAKSDFYRELVATMVHNVYVDHVPYYFQSEPNLRIQAPGEKCVPWHRDAEFGHQFAEWNVWIPLTPLTHPTQRLWVDDDRGTRPIEVDVGQAFMFHGATTWHGNMFNHGDERRSFDFRFIPKHFYRDTGKRTHKYDVPLSLGAYWSDPDV